MIFNIIKSLFLLITCSAVVSLPFAQNKWTYLQSFIISLFVQIICYNIYRTYTKYKFNELEVQKITEFSKQGAEITCPCSKGIKEFIPISLTHDNGYKCLTCNKNIAVSLEIKTYITTEPVNLEEPKNNIHDILLKLSNTEKNGI